jgi:hypothetical protein
MNRSPKVLSDLRLFIRNLQFVLEEILIYTNNLKNREFGQEAPQIFPPARAAVFEDTVRAREEKCGGKLTRGPQRRFVGRSGAPPKTDSSGCLCISAHYHAW